MPTPASIVVRASALALFFTTSASPALAAPPTKDECVEAHGKGQDARDGGRLARANKLFLTCAQEACPDLVRSDCARFADELQRIQPTVTFAARDGAHRDLPDTTVYVDGAQIAASLGDGRAYDVDPGRHEVRFVHGADEAVLTVVIVQGEKGRAIVGTFAAAAPPVTATPPPPAATAPGVPAPKRPAGPLVLVGLGAAAMAAGGALLGVGLARMPDNCSLATHTCAAPPKDPAFDRASSSVTFVNVGGIVGGTGAAVLGASLIWYFAQPLKPAAPAAAIAPWIGPHVAGLSFAGRL